MREIPALAAQPSYAAPASYAPTSYGPGSYAPASYAPGSAPSGAAPTPAPALPYAPGGPGLYDGASAFPHSGSSQGPAHRPADSEPITHRF